MHAPSRACLQPGVQVGVEAKPMNTTEMQQQNQSLHFKCACLELGVQVGIEAEGQHVPAPRGKVEQPKR